jgi:hypothetical protein
LNAKWFRLADRYLSRHDEEYRQERVNEKWTRLMKKMMMSQPSLFCWSDILGSEGIKREIQGYYKKEKSLVQRWRRLVLGLMGEQGLASVAVALRRTKGGQKRPMMD